MLRSAFSFITGKRSGAAARLLAFGLALLVAGGAAAEERRAPDKGARELMLAAHNARAVWNDFPGFTADVVIRTDGQIQTGTIQVGSDFEYDLKVAEEAKQPWVKAKLRSVISHRRPDPFTEDEFAFVPESGSEVAGQLVEQLDGSGTFRIRDGVLLEVLRKDDSQWMEISNLDMFVTAEGKQLPRTTSVAFRDPASGNLKSQLSNTFEWKRIGHFDLPTRTFTVEVGSNGKRTVREIVFRNHSLQAPSR